MNLVVKIYSFWFWNKNRNLYLNPNKYLITYSLLKYFRSPKPPANFTQINNLHWVTAIPSTQNVFLIQQETRVVTKVIDGKSATKTFKRDILRGEISPPANRVCSKHHGLVDAAWIRLNLQFISRDETQRALQSTFGFIVDRDLALHQRRPQEGQPLPKETDIAADQSADFIADGSESWVEQAEPHELTQKCTHDTKQTLSGLYLHFKPQEINEPVQLSVVNPGEKYHWRHWQKSRKESQVCREFVDESGGKTQNETLAKK